MNTLLKSVVCAATILAVASVALVADADEDSMSTDETLAAPVVPGCVTKFYNFSNATVPAEWTSSTTALKVDTAPKGERFLGRADGTDFGLSNDDVVLQLGNLPANGFVRLAFDLAA
jgi:hypothetical protein